MSLWQHNEPNTGWQQQAVAFARHHGLLHDPVTHALDLVSEVGEVAKEILLATAYGEQSQPTFRPQLPAELGDVMFSLLLLAEACDVDAGDALEIALGKYAHRLAERGGAGSNDERGASEM